MTDNASRQPKGIPVGGQFAATSHSEPDVALARPANPYCDADGTEWESGGDEYTDTYTSRLGGVEALVTTDIREEGARSKVIDLRGGRPLVISDQTLHDSLDEAKAHAKSVRERANRYSHNRISEGSRSPWGALQGVDPVAPGIDAVWTAGHGGFKLSPERAAEVDPAWREPAGWYEQDCAWAKAYVTHHRDLKPSDIEHAHREARKYFPDQYTAIVGKDPAKYGLTTFEPITAAESSILEKREFLAARAATHDRVARVDLNPAGHPGMIAVDLHDIAADGRDEDGAPVTNQRTVLIPEGEWKMPWSERRTIPKNNNHSVMSPAQA
jgi:hypothetical protein